MTGRHQSHALLWVIYFLVGATLIALAMFFMGCGGIEVTSGAEFKSGGVYYQTDGESHDVYLGASGDLVLTIGTFTVGVGERLSIDDNGLYSATELLMRLQETIPEGQQHPKALTYLEVKVSVIVDQESSTSQVCIDVEAGGYDVQPRCWPLPWIDQPDEIRVEGSTDGDTH